MFRGLILLIPYLFSLAAFASTPASSIPAVYRTAATEIRAQSLWKERLRLFLELKSKVEAGVKALPEEIPDRRIAEAQTLMEMKILMAELNEESLVPARCVSTRQLVTYWAGPGAEKDSDQGSVAQFVLELVQFVCNRS